MKISTYKGDYGKNGGKCRFEAGLLFWMYF